jgi:hypothetical protein
MSWNHVQRDMFIRGFLVGHREGFRRACIATIDLVKSTGKPDANGTSSCFASEQFFRKEVSYYENFVTDFYTKYPEDRDLPLRILIEDSEEKTPEQVHEWMKNVGK